MSRIHLKYFPDLPAGEKFIDTERKGNIHIANNIGSADYGPSSETGFFSGPIPDNDGYILYTYTLTNEQINSKPTINSGLSTPKKEGGTWSGNIIPEARYFADNTSLVNYYNIQYSNNLDFNGVVSSIDNNDNLYLETVVLDKGNNGTPTDGSPS